MKIKMFLRLLWVIVEISSRAWSVGDRQVCDFEIGRSEFPRYTRAIGWQVDPFVSNVLNQSWKSEREKKFSRFLLSNTST